MRITIINSCSNSVKKLHFTVVQYLSAHVAVVTSAAT